MERKKFAVAYSIKEAGADLENIDVINLHWYTTERGVEMLPVAKTLLRSFPPTKGKDFSAVALELEMKSSRDLRPHDEAWLAVAKSDARPGINDIGLELTPKAGLPDVQGGAALISMLLNAGWQPIEFSTIVKTSTEQRKVVQGQKPLETKKIIFKLSFSRPKNSQKPIEIPQEVLKLFASDRCVTWGFCHIWYNRAILRSVNINFTNALFYGRKRPFQWEITL